MTCVYDAPRGPAESQTTPAFPEQWHGPNGYMLLSWEVDFRSGGGARLCVRSPEGGDQWIEGIHLEIVEPERIVFSGTLATQGERLPETAGTVTFRRP